MMRRECEMGSRRCLSGAGLMFGVWLSIKSRNEYCYLDALWSQSPHPSISSFSIPRSLRNPSYTDQRGDQREIMLSVLALTSVVLLGIGKYISKLSIYLQHSKQSKVTLYLYNREFKSEALISLQFN